MKDLGELNSFLGLEVVHFEDCLHVSQQKYVRDLLEHARMTNAKPVNTPMVSSPTLTSLVGSPLLNGTLYRQVVGRLQYICLTRPDNVFAINKVSQYMQSPHDNHWIAMKRISCYVKGTMDYGLLFRPYDVRLIGFADVGWASSVEDRKSSSGFCLYLGDNIVG